jgi:hypothetical protein
MNNNNLPRCYFCDSNVDEDFLCYGCKHYVCDDCESAEPPFGPHTIDDHRIAKEKELKK